MTVLFDQIQEALAAIRSRTDRVPEVGIVLGTGLGDLARKVESPVEIPYSEIPHFMPSTVTSHTGQLVLGTLAGRTVLVMEGRLHYYEGYTLEQVTFPIRVIKALGAESLFVTNACGGVNHRYGKGDIVIIEDHINLMGVNPLIGPNDERLGPRFTDMCEPYTRALIEAAEAVALSKGIAAHRGVFAAMTGPCLETRAEYRMLQCLGADTIGMSTVPEVIVAVHAGLKVLGLSIITDMCLPDALAPVDVPDILAVAGAAGPKLEEIIQGVLGASAG